MIAPTKVVIIGAISDPVWLAILGVISTAIGATVTIFLALKTTNKKIDELKVTTAELKENTDGKLTKLLEVTGDAKLAEGKLAGMAQEKAESTVIAVAIEKIADTKKDPPEGPLMTT